MCQAAEFCSDFIFSDVMKPLQFIPFPQKSILDVLSSVNRELLGSRENIL